MIQELYKKLENSYLFDKKHNNILALIEGAFALVAGGFIGSVISKYDTKDLTFGVIFGILFLYLSYRRISKENNYSVSVLGELKSTIKLEEKIKEVERKNIIDNYIDDAIKSLNSNTCNTNIFLENHLCDQSIENGLKSVYHPYFNNPQNLLDTPKAKFTTGAYINWFLNLPPNFGTSNNPPTEDKNIFIPRDDFEFRQYFIKDQLTNPDLLGLSFFFQTQFLKTFKHNCFINETLTLDDGKEFTVITAPIPTVCEDGSLGVFFIISEKLTSIPSDFDNLCQIFGRLFSNWMSRYNECIENRCKQPFSIPNLSNQTAEVPNRIIDLADRNNQNGS
jgi:hypothetical protein